MISQFTDYDITYDITIIWYHSLTMIIITCDIIYYIVLYTMWCCALSQVISYVISLISQLCDIVDKKLWNHMWYHGVPRGTSDVISHLFHSSGRLGPAHAGLLSAIAGCSLVLDTDCSEDVFTPRGRASAPMGGGCTGPSRPVQAGPGAPAPLRASLLRWWWHRSVTTFSLILYRTLYLNLPAEQQTFRIENPAHTQTSRGMCCQEGSFVLKGPCVLKWFGALV
jgi:hypothetical protein